MFKGTRLYGSLNGLLGFSKSRRDDMESLAYMLIELLNPSFFKADNYQSLIQTKENIVENMKKDGKFDKEII